MGHSCGSYLLLTYLVAIRNVDHCGLEAYGLSQIVEPSIRLSGS